MNPLELNLQFPNRDQVNVRLDGVESGTLPFVMPLTAKDLRDIQWYVETYGVRSLGDPDDKEAKRISALLPEWGKTLFNAVFQERKAERIFNRFQETENGTRLLTVSAEHPATRARRARHGPQATSLLRLMAIEIGDKTVASV